MKIFSVFLKNYLTTWEVALMTDECHSKNVKEQKDDLLTLNRCLTEKASCGTRSRPSGCYTNLLFEN
jgi:hypothetical protein